jgi:hypothetical protein
MLRPILAILQLGIGRNGVSEAKRLAALAGVLGVILLSGALTANLALAAAIFLALQPIMAPAWAAALAAAAALLLASILVAAIRWLSGRARRRVNREAVASNATKAESAMLIGTLVSAFASGVISGMDRRPAPPRGEQL